MNIEEKLTVFSDILAEQGILKTKGIHETNHDPHPFTIGPKHITASNENGSGVITEEILEETGCAHPKCTLKYSEHKSDGVLFLQLTRDVTNEEVQGELMKIKDKLIELEVDGVAFVDSEEGYKFLGSPD